MQLKQRGATKIKAVRENQKNSSQADTAQDIELTPKEIAFIMQFGNYYPGFSPEWELFR
jgi:DNA-binding XRE family transcriptional regulator